MGPKSMPLNMGLEEKNPATTERGDGALEYVPVTRRKDTIMEHDGPSVGSTTPDRDDGR
jgi:hypothetical protein